KGQSSHSFPGHTAKFKTVPSGLKRYYGADHLHFINCSCYRRQRWLDSRRRRDLFLRVLEQVRQRYAFVVVGYVVMPEHIHLLNQRTGKGKSFTGDAGGEAGLRAPRPAADAEAPRGGPRRVVYGRDRARVAAPIL
ncbi:MAG: transposase, partial [Terriglobales bacterium]